MQLIMTGTIRNLFPEYGNDILRNFSSVLLPVGLSIAITFMVSTLGFSQEKKEVIPDGTQGEELEVVKGDTLPDKWKDKRWRLFPGKFSTL